MKHLRTKAGLLVLGLVLLVVAAVWWKGSGYVDAGAGTCCRPAEPLGRAGGSGVEAPSTPGGNPPAKPTVFLPEDIPPGIFRRQLEKLSPAALEVALETLGEMDFLPTDAESLRVDQAGGVFYVCRFEDRGACTSEAAVAPETSLAEPGIAGASVPVSSPPIRHSRPGAGKVLFLDFNGHVVSGTAWNNNANYGPTDLWDCRPYSTDGDETTFSATEQANIIQIWERVAEDYAPFDVDVTTEEPEVWDRYTGHALITPTSDRNGVECPHYGYGGIAYLSKFGYSSYEYYSPAWIAELSPANIAEAVSHELGHNMGLSHDGSSSAEYYHGHSNGGISWGSIMGSGYNCNVTQWSKGEYYDSNRSQDDLSIIAGKLGYRPDDHGDNRASATELAVALSGEVSQQGVVETTGDPDVFSFATGMGEITLSATPYMAASSTWGSNLDVLLELYDANGVLMATNNPANALAATIVVDVPSGVYYLYVKPTGSGTPLANPPTGFTVYGSLGQYTVSGVVSADADADGLPNAWETQYFGGFTNAIASGDADGDGADNLTEYVSGYDPTNPASVFQVLEFDAPSSGNASFVLWSDDLIYSPFVVLGANLPYTQNSFTDAVERTDPKNYYRVDVRLEE